MLASIMGPDLLIVLLVAVVFIFGGSQIPKLARSLGSAHKEFKQGQEETHTEAASVPGQNGHVATQSAHLPPPASSSAIQPANDRSEEPDRS